MINNKFSIVVIKLAFTLAEVLIVIGLIGVVAEMTIPTLMNNVTNLQFQSAFMENYSILQQVSKQIIQDNGGNILGVYTDQSQVMAAIVAKLKVQRTCVAAQAAGKCWSTTTKNLSGTANAATITPGSETAVLLNGAVIQVDNTIYNNTCTSFNWYPVQGNTGVCAVINLDVNGMTGPNRVGRDVFQFYFANLTGIVPDGIPNTDDYDSSWSNCDPASTNAYNGIACGGRIVVQGGVKY